MSAGHRFYPTLLYDRVCHSCLCFSKVKGPCLRENMQIVNQPGVMGAISDDGNSFSAGVKILDYGSYK